MRVKEGNKWKDIHEAAIKIFAEYGYFNAKIAKIAELAGVATGSVYLYYKNKEDLLHSIFDSLWKKMYDNSLYLRDNKELSPAEKLDLMFDAIFRIFSEHPDLAILSINEHSTYLSLNKNQNPRYYNEFFDTASEIVSEGIKKNVFAADINIELFKDIIIGSFRELVRHWSMNKKVAKMDDIRKTYKYIMKHGIMKHK